MHADALWQTNLLLALPLQELREDLGLEDLVSCLRLTKSPELPAPRKAKTQPRQGGQV